MRERRTALKLRRLLGALRGLRCSLHVRRGELSLSCRTNLARLRRTSCLRQTFSRLGLHIGGHDGLLLRGGELAGSDPLLKLDRQSWDDRRHSSF